MKGSKQTEGKCGLAYRGRWRRVMKKHFPFRKFRSEIKWNRPFWFGLTGIFGTTFEGGRPHLTGLVISVGGTDMSLSIWQIVVLSTAPLYPACKNNKKTRGGLGRVCVSGMYRSIEHVKLPKFQTEIFVEWKAPKVNESWWRRTK